MVSPKITKLAGALKGSSLIATKAAVSVQTVIAQQAKAQSFASKNAKDINNNALLPDKEREALAKIVDEAVTLNAPVILQTVSITNAGKFEVILALDPSFPLGSSILSSQQKTRVADALKAKVSALIGKHGAWDKPSGSSISFKSKTTYGFLKNAKTPSSAYLAHLGFKSSNFNTLELKLLWAAEQAENKGQALTSQAFTVILGTLKASKTGIGPRIRRAQSNPVGGTRKARAMDMLNRFISPALADMGVLNRDAEALLLGTAIVESSGFRHTRQQPSGPGRGFFQVEDVTHKDIWTIYLRRSANRHYVGPITNMLSTAGQNEAINTPSVFNTRYLELETNPKYCAAIAYLKYEWFTKGAWPSSKNISALAATWKTYYNTSSGAGSIQDFEDGWNFMLNQGKPGFTLP